jgi:hypothetical protein
MTVNILGTINSAGVPISGTLSVSLPSIVINTNTNPDTIMTPAVRVFAIAASGNVNINLPETQTSGTPYLFSFIQTGATKPLFSINAVVPNVATVQFASFFPTGISRRTLDTSALRVARLLATDQTLSQLIKQPAVFTVVANGITAEQTYFIPKPFEGAINVRALSVLGLSGYALWDFDLGILDSSGNESVLVSASTVSETQNGRRRIHQSYDISRASTVLGLFVRATPQVGASALNATLIATYTEI